ncbi:unnamed protein product [Cylindrotheca closterium]|uniref:Myb-like domain-containing protein n=1 Tax=Cylindrotheca closterium TaxID=2856 RepID=A0AAD2CGT2_9STRA|nr:unnamed protein product [Cylindrotheca closterium]
MEFPNAATFPTDTTDTTDTIDNTNNTNNTDTTLKEVNYGKKREVVTLRPEEQQEDMMKKRNKVANHVKKDVEQNDGNSNESHRVCKFLVQNLKASGDRYASNEYSVSLLVGKNSLYDFVLKVFEILHEARLTDDDYYSHLWSIVFDGTEYHNGWRACPPCLGAPGRLIDEQDVRPLDDLGLQVGRRGKFKGQSAIFDFTVKEIDGVPEQDAQYPKHSAIQITFSSALSDDWISEAKKKACLKARDDWYNYYNDSSASSKYKQEIRETIVIVNCKPLAPEWTREEIELLGLLMNAGHKFGKSWKMILQYGIVRRSQSASSYQWYKLQKETFKTEWIGRGKTAVEMMLLVKRLAKARVENIPVPLSRTEIAEERRRLTRRVQMNRMGFESSDDSVVARGLYGNRMGGRQEM